ncbi:MAG: hypothetical protein EBX52_07700, partial [Proteobacteria bacterium]|nr:hypothetical protein [Pseudomonadota bacterium]
VSWLSYQEAVHQLIDATRPAPQPLPVISYVPPVGLSEGPGLDRYFHDLDAIRDFVKIQPVYLIVPDREAGAWRLHFVDHSNVQHFFDFLRRDFNPCDLLLRK